MEYTYEPIETIALRNFRKVREASIDFTKSPIVTVIGPNNVGKSAISFAVRAIGSNIQMKKHKRYIRSKQNEWEVLFVTRSAMVHRIKSQTGQKMMIYARKPDGKTETVFSIDKMDGSSMPPEVDKIVGFCIEAETKQLLNVRTYQDQLIFVDTPTSTNYKVVYSALKVESLYKASQIGNKEIGTKEKEISELRVEVDTRNTQLRKLRTVDIEPILKIRAELQKRLKVLEVVARLRETMLESQQLKSQAQLLMQVGQLKRIPEETVGCLNRALGAILEVRELNAKEALNREVMQLQKVDERPLLSFMNLINATKERNSMHTNTLQLVKQLSTVSDNKVRALAMFEELEKVSSQVSIIKASVNKEVLNLPMYNTDILEKLVALKNSLADKQSAQERYKEHKKLADDLHAKLHSCGALVGSCPNCGELVVMEQ